MASGSSISYSAIGYVIMDKSPKIFFSVNLNVISVRMWLILRTILFTLVLMLRFSAQIQWGPDLQEWCITKFAKYKSKKK